MKLKRNDDSVAYKNKEQNIFRSQAETTCISLSLCNLKTE